MSAWLVTDTHISAIVQQMIAMNVISPVIADDVWKQMKFQNHYALHVRYGDELPCDDWQELECKRTVADAPLSKPVIWKSISCWLYQCAEFEDYDKSYVSRLANELQAKIEVDIVGDKIVLGGMYDRPDTKAEAAYHMLSKLADEDFGGHCWGINRWSQAIKPRQEVQL